MTDPRVSASAAVLCLLLTGAPANGQARAAVAATPDLSASLESATALVSPSIVQIFATGFAAGNGVVPSTADLITTQRASGSGVIVDAAGFIITNAHVVRGAQRLRVEVPIPVTGRSILATRSRSVPGELVGIDVETDLAVIKIEGPKLPALAFGDSDELKAGQLVLAFGSPLGMQNSVSLGVVSAVARQLEPESPMVYVQTDASINPGSSGGALVDLRGRLIGINTLILAQPGTAEGPGFAAPSSIVRAVYEQIRKTGRVRRGDIGVRAQTVTPVLAAGLGLPRDYGVVLSDVLPGGPAAKAGLLPGDLIVSADGKPMENGRQFQVSLYRRYIGDVMELEILRNKEPMKMFVAMTERSDSFAGLTPAADPRQHLVPRLGILGVTLDPQIAQMLPLARVSSGVVVASTVAGAIDARDGGLAAGDIVYAVNRRPVAGLSELRVALDAMKPGDPVVLQLQRRGELMFLAFSVE